jgi:hypothetical protein
MITVQWECVDHAVVTGYEGGWIRPAEAAPAIVQDLGKPATLPTPVPVAHPGAFGSFQFLVRAVGSDGTGSVMSAWSEPSAQVVFLPAAPTQVVLVVG